MAAQSGFLFGFSLFLLLPFAKSCRALAVPAVPAASPLPFVSLPVPGHGESPSRTQLSSLCQGRFGAEIKTAGGFPVHCEMRGIRKASLAGSSFSIGKHNL